MTGPDSPDYDADVSAMQVLLSHEIWKVVWENKGDIAPNVEDDFWTNFNELPLTERVRFMDRGYCNLLTKLEQYMEGKRLDYKF